jgi:hypothetical protein
MICERKDYSRWKIFYEEYFFVFKHKNTGPGGGIK